MDNDRKKELKQQYAERKPEKGIVCWQCCDQMWVHPSNDTKADYNSSLFQLQLGSWVNKEMQAAFNAYSEDAFVWRVLKVLDYEDPHADLTDDLELLLMEVMDEYPQAKPMKPRKK